MHLYPHVFRNSQVIVAKETPEAARLAIVSALTPEAYECSEEDPYLFDDWYSDQLILRQRDLFIISRQTSSGQQNFVFRIEMLEPMQQCYAEKGITKLILVAPDANISLPLDVSPHLDDASDADPIEIDEEFLANSVLSNQLEGFASQAPESHNQHSNAEGLKAAGLGGMQHSLVCLPTVHDAVEDDINIYLRTADLAKVGVRSGDWVCPIFHLPFPDK